MNRPPVFGVIVTVMIGAVVGGCTVTAHKPAASTTPLALPHASAPASLPAGDPATVTRVVDGDTFDAIIDLGYGVSFTTSIRVLGENAGEHGTPCGDAATKAVTEKIASYGNKVVIGKHQNDKFGGRQDAVVLLPDGTDLTQWTITNGYAVAWNGRGVKPSPASCGTG